MHACLRPLDVLVLLVCGGVLLHAFGIEPFHVPTGSMAPTLLGHRLACTCPQCGTTFAVGRSTDGDTRTCCPNCGQSLSSGDMAETAGDHILVNKTAFALRRPRRWEVVVFRLFGIVLVKRIVGLPGEAVLVKDGDLLIDGRLARKSFAQAWAMHVPLSGAAESWQATLLLDARGGPQVYAYSNGPPVEGKYPPLRDEYAYNASRRGGTEPVHDFLMEADVEVQAGNGSLAVRLCDGQDWVEVTLPAGCAGALTTRSWPVDTPARVTTWISRETGPVLRPRRKHHVAMAFVDRRVNVTVDGRPVVENIDLPDPESRDGVGLPMQLSAVGACIAVRQSRLYRDIHYTCRGRTAVYGEPVHLGVEQYFVLGDNSANSDDSRFWSPDAVSGAQLVGSAFLVHLPSRVWHWQLVGHSGACQVPDFARMRWIR